MSSLYTDAEVVDLWVKRVVNHARELDAEADKGGHDWHSLWVGFCCALGRHDLAVYENYMRLGFPEEDKWFTAHPEEE